MASGVEMLGQMSQTDALAGPVQGGNMVVKPNEVPVGGAAMLAKAMRGQADRGVSGIYELPSQQQPTPEFMQMAQQGVKDDMTRMTRMIQNEAPPGEMLAYINPEEAGILQMLGGSGDIQPTTGIPSFRPRYTEDKSKSASNNYSSNVETNRERGMRQSNTGSKYDSDVAKYAESQGVSTNEANRRASGVDDQGGTSGATDEYNRRERIRTNTTTDEDKRQMAAITAETGKDPHGSRKNKIGNEVLRNKKNAEKATIQEQLDDLNIKKQDGKLSKEDKKLFKSLTKESKALDKILQGIFEDQQKNMYGDLDAANISEDDEKKLQDIIRTQGFGALDSADAAKWRTIQAAKQKHGLFKLFDGIGYSRDMPGVNASIKSLGSDSNLANVGFNQGHLNPDGTLSEAGEYFYNMYDDKMGFVGMGDKDAYADKLNSLYGFDAQGNPEMRSDVLAGTQAQKSIDPKKYYLESDKAKYFRGGTGGSMEELAGVALTGDSFFDGKILEARRINNQNKDRYDRNNPDPNNRPQFMDRIQEEVIETPDGVVDEESQTMKYTSPRTGGVEQSVPLQRRFRTDPTQEVAQYRTTPRTEADILKYMTEGTTGEGIGLEPFSEYQRRRRKALGLEDLELFN